MNYDGPWLHPLSPYYIDKDNQPNPVHPEPGGIGYRHWLGLVENISDNTEEIARVCGAVPETAAEKMADSGLLATTWTIMKARCWYDAEMPIIFASEDMEAEYKGQIEAMIHAAQQVADEVRRHVKNALFGPQARNQGRSFVY